MKKVEFNVQDLSEINPQTFENAFLNSAFEWQNCISQQTILGVTFVVKLNRLLGRFIDGIIDSSADKKWTNANQSID